ncbi:hypothetical protein KY334_08050 [Candidatus Woesearchaeota archaeon]|nr:hypothetical protein [Candidatus Woesearchaeota archaeon]
MSSNISKLKEAVQSYNSGDYNGAGLKLFDLYEDNSLPSSIKTSVRLNLAKVYVSKKKFKTAKYLLNENLEENPKEYSSLFELGLLYEKNLKLENHLFLARDTFSKLDSSSPNYKAASQNLEGILTQIKVNRKLDHYLNKSDGNLNLRCSIELSELFRELDLLDICSSYKDFCVKASNIYKNAKEALIRMEREKGKFTPDIIKEHKNQLSILEKLISKFYEKAGLDI